MFQQALASMLFGTRVLMLITYCAEGLQTQLPCLCLVAFLLLHNCFIEHRTIGFKPVEEIIMCAALKNQDRFDVTTDRLVLCMPYFSILLRVALCPA